MGARSGAPSGFALYQSSFSKPPVAVQLPQPDVSANRDAPHSSSTSSSTTKSSERSSTRLAGRASFCSAVSPRAKLRCWNGCATSCASGTMSQSSSTSTSRRRRTSPRRAAAGCLSNFVIADITNPKSSPLELQATVPEIIVPFQPIIEQGEKPFAMLQDLWIKHRDWVFEPIEYSSIDRLIETMDGGDHRPRREAVRRAGGAES